MFKSLIILTAIFICFSTLTFAQNDTSSYDLGRISVKKEFTQSITIKGSDLEHYQFTNLADAINVWLYGTYSNASSLIYVVDGSIITDVNAYSIYDIEEITLVQNALALTGGSNADQQMVLIKLKTSDPGKQGLEINGQTSLINFRKPINSYYETSTTSLYNQFYIRGYKNYKNLSLGISVDYQRDAFPTVNGNYNDLQNANETNNSNASSNLNRIKLNAYLKANLGSGNTFNLRINYLPQTYNEEQNSAFINNTTLIYPPYLASSSTNFSDKINEHVFNLNLSLNTKFNNELSNTFTISENHFNYTEDFFYNTTAVYYDQDSSFTTIAKYTGSLNNLLIKDNLNYHKSWKNLNLDAAVNFSYRNFTDSTLFNTVSTNYLTNFTSSFYNQSNNQTSYGGNNIHFQLYFITPTISFYHKGRFNIQMGFVNLLNSDKDFISNNNVDKLFPFVTATLYAGKLLGINNDEFKIFGSFSRQSQLLADYYTNLVDFNAPNTSPANTNFQLGSSDGFKNNMYSSTTNPYNSYNNFQIGAELKVGQNLILDYSFEDRYYKTLGSVLDYLNNAYGYNSYQTPYFFDDKIITNRIGLNYTLKSNKINWRMGFNVSQTQLQIKMHDDINNTNNFTDQYYVNNLSEGYRWSGGFTNRLNYKTFFAGLDLLYQIGNRNYNLYNLNLTLDTRTVPLDNNSFSLQNLYVGERLKISKLNYAEVYINGRNILQNSSSNITDNRRYFGAGFKVAL
jgi:hypothetical protein